MADDFLSSLGTGLQNAGGILSDRVFDRMMDQRQFMQQATMQRQAQIGHTILAGIQNGTVNPNDPQVQAVLKGMGLPAMSASPQAKMAQMEVESTQGFLDRIRQAQQGAAVPPPPNQPPPAVQGGLQPSALAGGINFQPSDMLSPLFKPYMEMMRANQPKYEKIGPDLYAIPPMGGQPQKVITGKEYKEREIPLPGDMLQKQFRNSPDEEWQPLGAPVHKFARQVPSVIKVGGGGGEGGAGKSPLNDANADLHGKDFLAKLPYQDRVSVQALLDYDMDPKTIPPRMVEIDGRKQSRREYLFALARQADPAWSETRFQEKKTALNEFQRSKGNAVRFLNVSIDHIDTASEYAKALSNGDVQRVNQLRNWWQQETGQTAPNTFNGIKDIVASEVIKGAIGGPGGVEERRENAEKVKAANSPEQLAQLFEGWKKLMAGQMKGLEKAYESGTGLKNFREKYMLPNARKALEDVSSEVGKGADAPTGSGAKDSKGAISLDAYLKSKGY